MQNLFKAFTVGAACVMAGKLGLTYIAPTQQVYADSDSSGAPGRVVGSFDAGGLVFKDKVEVVAVPDPKVEGLTCYISNVNRGFNPFTDPSKSSISVCQTGDIKFRSTIDTSKEGEEIFKSNKNLFFKEQKVRRLYDPVTNSLLYISYNTRLLHDKESSSRFTSSIACVPLRDIKPAIH